MGVCLGELEEEFQQRQDPWRSENCNQIKTFWAKEWVKVLRGVLRTKHYSERRDRERKWNKETKNWNTKEQKWERERESLNLGNNEIYANWLVMYLHANYKITPHIYVKNPIIVVGMKIEFEPNSFILGSNF